MEKKHFLKLIIIVLAISLSFLVMVGPTQNSHAVPIVYTADLRGANEDPPNDSLGTGFARVVFDVVAHTMEVDVWFSGLTGNTTASHIHAATAVAGVGNVGVATQLPTFIGFPLGVKSGTYDSPTFDLTQASSWNPSFITNHGGTPASAEAALVQAAFDGKAYLNIHTTFRPGGEIRGFLAQPVPEPSTLLLLGSGLIGLAGYGRKKFLKK